MNNQTRNKLIITVAIVALIIEFIIDEQSTTAVWCLGAVETGLGLLRDWAGV